LDQQYPNFPQEYRFNYNAIPNSGTATITVRLKKLTTSIYTNHFTTLTRAINTAAPAQVLHISAPAADGQTLVLNTNNTYAILACFTQTLTTNNIDAFSIYINGALQPRRATNGTPLYAISAFGCAGGLRSLGYNWTGITPGTNVIQVVFTNGVLTLNDVRTVMVSPFHITSVSGGLVTWESVSNHNYQVLATTNLNYPMVPISPVIPASGATTFFFDPAPDPTNKFYRVQALP
jgi:hypothetical protein